MAMMGLGRSLLDIEPCRYGYSRLTFRGPEAELKEPYIAFLGATETVGPFLTRPYPALVAEQMGMGCVNLGLKNAGPDVFLNDPEILRIAGGAEAVVLEVMGATNLTNAYYKVHPRRNDRFIRAFEPLLAGSPGLDLEDVHFTGHLMNTIERQAGHILPAVIAELQSCWVARMKALIQAIGVPVHLVRFVAEENEPPIAAHVDAVMLTSVASYAASVTRIKPSLEARANGTSEMFFAPQEAAVALKMLSAEAHRETAEAVVETLGKKAKRARVM